MHGPPFFTIQNICRPHSIQVINQNPPPSSLQEPAQNCPIAPHVQAKTYNQKNPRSLRTYTEHWYPQLLCSKEYSQANLPTSLTNHGPHTMAFPKQSSPGPCFLASSQIHFLFTSQACLGGQHPQWACRGTPGDWGPHSPTPGVNKPQAGRIPPKSPLLLPNSKLGSCCPLPPSRQNSRGWYSWW